jgi:hypothetical protein
MPGLKRRLDQVVRDRRGDGEQQAGRGRQRGGETAGGDQRDHPAGKLCDFRVGQHEDVAVDGDSSLPFQPNSCALAAKSAFLSL